MCIFHAKIDVQYLSVLCVFIVGISCVIYFVESPLALITREMRKSHNSNDRNSINWTVDGNKMISLFVGEPHN